MLNSSRRIHKTVANRIFSRSLIRWLCCFKRARERRIKRFVRGATRLLYAENVLSLSFFLWDLPTSRNLTVNLAKSNIIRRSSRKKQKQARETTKKRFLCGEEERKKERKRERRKKEKEFFFFPASCVSRESFHKVSFFLSRFGRRLFSAIFSRWLACWLAC